MFETVLAMYASRQKQSPPQVIQELENIFKRIMTLFRLFRGFRVRELGTGARKCLCKWQVTYLKSHCLSLILQEVYDVIYFFFKPLIGRFKCGADGCLILLQCGLSAQSSLCSSFIPHTAGQCSWLIMPSSVLMINPKNPGTSQMNVFSSHILALYETAPVCLSSLMTTEFPLRSINRNLFGH